MLCGLSWLRGYIAWRPVAASGGKWQRGSRRAPMKSPAVHPTPAALAIRRTKTDARPALPATTAISEAKHERAKEDERQESVP